MEPLTAVHLSRYTTIHRLASLARQGIAQSRIDANEDLDAQMGRKKNAKKLSHQQLAATDQPTPTPTQIQMVTSQAPPPAPPAQQQGQSKKKRKKKNKGNQIQNEEQLRQEHGQVPNFTSRQAGPDEDPTAYFAPGHGFGGGIEAQSGEGSFVGQPLLDALDTIQPGGSEVQAPGPGKRTSLVWRPAQGTAINDGPPPGAPTGPKSAQNVPPPGAPTGPRSSAKPQPQPGPPRGSFPPQSQASSADGASSRAPSSSQTAHFPPQQSSGSSNDNPYGYNLQNAAWDWNTFSSANNAPAKPGNGKGSSDWNSSRSVAPMSDQYVNTDSTYWPGVYDTMGGFSQQAYNSQQHTYGQPPEGGVWLQQHQPGIVYQSGYYAGYHGSNDMRHIHGHANSFAPRVPTTSVNHYYQGHSWRVDKHYRTSNRGFATKSRKTGGLMSPERTSGSEGSDKVGDVRRSKRLAAKEIAEQEVARAWDNIQGPGQFRSPSPHRKWDRQFRSPSPRKAMKGPPQPEPTQEYLQKASIPSKQLDHPQTLLVIIDLNGTLVHRPSRKNSSRVVCRPYVQAFLDYLLNNHRVMVWSSARPENVGKMCNQLFDPARRAQVLAEWGRDTLGLTQQQYNEKVQVFKVLRKAWLAADRERWHPDHAGGGRFGQHNTFLVDDSLLKASSEPHNLVQVEEFEGRPDQMRRDVLRRVVGYLEQAKWMNDVSAWVKAGQRFGADGGWDYSWPEGTVAESLPQPLAGGPGVGGGQVRWPR
ncbi:hypothetical protein SLS56_008800 [Neofusicoccum ribis]|uniref:FCP1 homology domain-containing protein n=1 Tax=Neofusicoccum ribis TaxID=45134 RepID=A0ABR3SJ66_9PEZI